MRVSGQFTNLDDIRNVPITAGGRTIKLGDIATVKLGFQDPPVYTAPPQRPGRAGWSAS